MICANRPLYGARASVTAVSIPLPPASAAAAAACEAAAGCPSPSEPLAVHTRSTGHCRSLEVSRARPPKLTVEENRAGDDGGRNAQPKELASDYIESAGAEE